MSSIKEYLFDLQNENAEEWIRERLEDKDAGEDSEEWTQLAKEYSDYQEYLLEEAEYQAELEWLRKNGSSMIHKFFVSELDALDRIARDNLDRKNMAFMLNSQMIIKMAFAYSVTLMEAFLSDTLKSLLNESDTFLENAIANVEELKKAKYCLKELMTKEVDAKELAIRKVSEILFHNIPKVKVIYEQVLDKKLDIDISKVSRITEIRHNIIHRNGATLDGETIVVNAEDLSETISLIKEFTSNLQVEINGVLSA